MKFTRPAVRRAIADFLGAGANHDNVPTRLFLSDVDAIVQDVDAVLPGLTNR